MVEPNILVQVAGFIVTLVTGSIVGTRALSNMELRLAERIAQAEKEVDDRIERQYREFGEGLQAARQKMNEMELYGRDNYVRRGSFERVQEQMTTDVRTLGEKIDLRLERMEQKIDIARKTQIHED